MVCKPCRRRDHEGCPERARQLDPSISDIDKAGSRLCDCAHETVTALATRRD
jgi:hypothetical protein